LKAKHEPEAFRDDLVDIIKETEGDLEKLTKALSDSADDLDFKKYAEVLFDVLFTGGMLDNGGGIILDDDAELSPFSIFATAEDLPSIKKSVDVFNLLIRRYRFPFLFSFSPFPFLLIIIFFFFSFFSIFSFFFEDLVSNLLND